MKEGVEEGKVRNPKRLEESRASERARRKGLYPWTDTCGGVEEP